LNKAGNSWMLSMGWVHPMVDITHWHSCHVHASCGQDQKWKVLKTWLRNNTCSPHLGKFAPKKLGTQQIFCLTYQIPWESCKGFPDSFSFTGSWIIHQRDCSLRPIANVRIMLTLRLCLIDIRFLLCVASPVT
jgi:hypothetical protein